MKKVLWLLVGALLLGALAYVVEKPSELAP